jgi:hypothetical protein
VGYIVAVAVVALAVIVTISARRPLRQNRDRNDMFDTTALPPASLDEARSNQGQHPREADE